MSPTRSFCHGVLEALLLPLAFTALGLGWWGAVLGAQGEPPTYPPVLMESTPTADAEATVWLVDGFNVVQVGLLGGQDRSQWWSGERRAQLLARAADFQPAGSSVQVVFDGGSPVQPSDSTGRAEVVFAPSADEWIVAQVRSAGDPSGLMVVTADRRLAGRVRHFGARVASPAEFLARCTVFSNRGDITSV